MSVQIILDISGGKNIISLALTKHFPSLRQVIWNATTVEALGHELDNRATAEYTTGFRTKTQRKVRFPVV